MVSLLLEQVTDPVVRENFQKLDEFLVTEPLLAHGYKFFRLKFTAAISNVTIRHGLSFKPNALIQVFLEGAGTVTWAYNSFTSEVIQLTIGGTVTATNPTTVSFYLGSIPVGL